MRKRVPDGFYISLKPGNPLEWSGVLFLRKGIHSSNIASISVSVHQIILIGPYAPAILRFLIFFSQDYPNLPPKITFVTDVFHPLITPLTTYTYTTSSISSDTISASDDERLPPGGFNLRLGFPNWFGRVHKSGESSTLSFSVANIDISRNISMKASSEAKVLEDDIEVTSSEDPSPRSSSIPTTNTNYGCKKVTVIEVLEYMKRAFYDDQFLDKVPLEAAGNPGAWRAWRAHRTSRGVKLEGTGKIGESVDDREDWNWDGVWEQRVRKGIESSISDSTLYAGSSSGDDTVGPPPKILNQV